MDTLSYTIVFFCFSGTIFNLISTIVLFNISSKQLIFKWMLSNSFLNMIYLFLTGFGYILRLNPYFSYDFLYWYHRFYVHIFICTCLRFTIILIQATICYIRYSLISNYKINRIFKYFKTIIFLFFILIWQ